RRPDGSSEAVRVAGPLRCNDDQMLKRAGGDGYGAINMPEIFIADELAAGALVELLPGYALAPFSLAAVFPTRANLAPKVRACVAWLARHFGGAQANT